MSVFSPFLPYILCSSKAGARAAVLPASGYETASVRGIKVNEHG